jgi:hypothetical protein
MGWTALSAVALLGLHSCDVGFAQRAAPVPEQAGGAVSVETVRRVADPFDADRMMAGDVRTSDWLLERFRQIGLRTEEHAWTLRQFFLEDAFIEDAAGRIEAFPLWLPRATGPGGVRGRLTVMNASTPPAELAGAVVWIETGEGAAAAVNREILERRAAEAGAVAVVFATNDRGGRGHYVAENAERQYVDVERPLPAVTFGAGDEARLRESIGREIRVTISGRMVEAAGARNIIGRLVRDEAADWIVVSTPSSGWFTCAGERGPGIAILLALAEWAAAQPTGLNYFFVANSGHELDFLGSRLLQAAHLAPPPERTRAWLHLGAQIATPPWREIDGEFRSTGTVTSGTLQASEPLAPLMREAFAELPMFTLRTDTQIGEFRDVVEHGYSALGIVGGGNPWFHVPLDDPSTVDPSTLAAVARATSRALAAAEALRRGSASTGTPSSTLDVATTIGR